MRKLFVLLFGICVIFGGLFVGKTQPVSAESMFKDINPDFRAYDEISYLAEGKITLGLNGNFYPSDKLTRAEAVTFIGRALSLDGTKRATAYSDVDQASFASGYIQSAVDRGIVSGYLDGTFKPNKFITRGEMALILSRAFYYNARSTTDAVAKITSAGIAQGYADGSFGENNQIIRADFAVFLSRAINLDFRVGFEASVIGNGVVTSSDGLNVRTGPSTSYPIIGNIPTEGEVKIHQLVGKWAQIEFEAGKGFVHAGYLKMVLDITSGDPFLHEKIVIDAGHGGYDNGASGHDLLEKSINLDTALRVEKYLKSAGINVYLTRRSDEYISLQDRVALAMRNGGTTFVSIHTNSFNGKAHGTETFYYSTSYQNPYEDESKRLADAIRKRLVTAWNAYDRGTKIGNFHVIREIDMPATLVELGFIDHDGDALKLGSNEWKEKAAYAIFQGIMDYYHQK